MFTQLLVPLDCSPLAEQALAPAVNLAHRTSGDLDVVLVHQPIAVTGFMNSSWDKDVQAAERSYLDNITNDLTGGATTRVTHELLEGDVVDAICDRAREVKSDLIVMTSHGRTGWSRAWLGSVADGIIRHAAVPVLMLRPRSRKEDRTPSARLFRRILVLLDGSASSEEILSPASSLASASDADLVLLRIVEPVPLATATSAVPFGVPEVGIPSSYALVQDIQATEARREKAMQQLAHIASTLDSAGAIKVETHVKVDERVAKGIIDFAETHGIDVIAMCSHGRGGTRLIVGSVADKVIRATALPILMFRPAESHAHQAETPSADASQQLATLRMY